MARARFAFLAVALTAAVVVAQDTATVPQTDERAIVQKVLEEHGAAPVVQWIQQRRLGRITIEVGGKLKPAVGPPNTKYVTPSSVLADLKLAKVDARTFAEEIAAGGPVEKREMVISQQDVGPAGGGAQSSATGTRSQGGPTSCRDLSGQTALRTASSRGCHDGRVLSAEEENKDYVMFEVFQVTGECRDAATEKTRTFTARVKCTSSPTARLTVEGPNGFVDAAVHTSTLSFAFTD
jgi:hypothetical protein